MEDIPVSFQRMFYVVKKSASKDAKNVFKILSDAFSTKSCQITATTVKSPPGGGSSATNNVYAAYDLAAHLLQKPNHLLNQIQKYLRKHITRHK